jgi:hypothetical protein
VRRHGRLHRGALKPRIKQFLPAVVTFSFFHFFCLGMAQRTSQQLSLGMSKPSIGERFFSDKEIKHSPSKVSLRCKIRFLSSNP